MPLDHSLKDSILNSVAEGFADQLAFTQDLMRFASTRGSEQAIQDFVYRAYRSRSSSSAQISPRRVGSSVYGLR